MVRVAAAEQLPLVDHQQDQLLAAATVDLDILGHLQVIHMAVVAVAVVLVLIRTRLVSVDQVAGVPVLIMYQLLQLLAHMELAVVAAVVVMLLQGYPVLLEQVALDL